MRKRPSLVDHLATELIILRSAWVLAGDDDRRRKPLHISPADIKRWNVLIKRAGRTPILSSND